MNKYLAMGVIAACLTCFGVTAAHAADAGPDTAEVNSTDVVPVQPGELKTEADGFAEVRTFWQAVNAKEWLPATASFLMLLVYVARRWLFGWVDWFSTRWGGAAFAFGVAGGAALGVGIKAGVPFGFELVMGSLATALTAGGVWALRRVPQKKPAPRST